VSFLCAVIIVFEVFLWIVIRSSCVISWFVASQYQDLLKMYIWLVSDPVLSCYVEVNVVASGSDRRVYTEPWSVQSFCAWYVNTLYQLQPANSPSETTGFQTVNEGIRAYEYVPWSEPKLISHSEVLQAIMGLRVGQTPSPNGISNRVLRHVRKRAITLLTKVFDAVLRKQYFSPAQKHAHVVSILKSGKTPRCLLPKDGYFLNSVGEFF
jgi:hypothetical protein